MERKQAAGLTLALLIAGIGNQLSARATKLPEPLASVVMLLGWSGDDVPHIEIVNGRPLTGTATVEAWVNFDSNGQAIPVIFIRSDTDVYREAANMDYQALVRLAGILAHERRHITHGRDEVGAYTVQLSTMECLHANATRLAEVRRALARVIREAKARH